MTRRQALRIAAMHRRRREAKHPYPSELGKPALEARLKAMREGKRH